MNEIDEFLENFTSPSTRKGYRSNIKNYFKFLGEDPDTYFDKDRNYKQDVIRFSRSLVNRPPCSQQSIMSTVKMFLSEYDVEIKDKVWRNIRNRRGGTRPIIQECVPNNAELKQILQYGGIKARALFLIVSSSGMRIKETLQLTIDDIDLEKRWIKIPFKTTKSRSGRETGFTSEAKDALVEWLKYRDKFLMCGYRKSKFLRKKYEKKGISVKKKGDKWIFVKGDKEIDAHLIEKRVFPFGDGCARTIWNTLLERAGPPFNEKDEQEALAAPHYKYHIHTLRKFWFTEMRNSEANESHVNVMGGHDSSLDSRYIKPRTETLRTTYEEHSGCLEIFSERWKIDRDIKPKLKEQGTLIANVVSRNKDLEAEIGNLRKSVDILHGAMKNVLLPDIEHEQMLREFDEQDQLIKRCMPNRL